MRGLRSRNCGRYLALLVVGATGLAIVGGVAADRPATRAGLRRDVATLSARTHQALLDLYASETALARARARRDLLTGALGRLRAQQRLLRRELSVAGRAHSLSERQLALRLKSLYEQQRPDPLVVILGARSFDEALTSIDALDRSAKQDSAIVQQTAATRRAFVRIGSQLAMQTRRVARLAQQASASVDALAQARAERAALVSRLQTKEQLSRRRLASLEAVVQVAEVKTQSLTAAASSSAADPATSTSSDTVPSTSTSTSTDAGTTAAPAGGRAITVSSTGYSLPGRTSTGLPVGWGVVAVDPAVIPLGTHLTIPGYGEAVAADTGGAVRGATIDLWFPSLAQARAWGRRTVTISVH